MKKNLELFDYAKQRIFVVLSVIYIIAVTAVARNLYNLLDINVLD